MNDWDDWYAKATHAQALDMSLPKRIRDMHAMHGKSDGHTCGECAHCRKLEGYAGSYHKCELSRMSHGSGTDWRKRWPACGKFGAKEGEK